MDLLKTGIGLTKTIKNVSRFREIITVFWKNGLDEFIIQSNVHKFIPRFVYPNKTLKKIDSKTEDLWEAIGFRLRKSFEELGPSFIKLGQLLSTREDLFDPSLIKELKKLQDNASDLDFKIVKDEIERSFGKKLSDIFSDFNETPIGKASIGVVYKARLLSGEDVVVKFRRPNIKKILHVDFEIIQFLVEQLEKISSDFKFLGVSRATEDFFKNTLLEINFHIEANNAKKIKENLSKYDENLFFIPNIYSEFTKSNIIVMDYVQGISFNKIKDLKEHNLEEKLNLSVKYFIKSLLQDGFFHADLHGGNFFILPNGQIGLIDFGLMGNLSRKNRISLVAILYALLSQNFENLVYEFLDIADYEKIPNPEVLINDLQETLLPHLGLSVQETDITILFSGIVKTLSKHEIYLPREWFIIFRALITLDGVGKSLDFDVNVFNYISSEIEEIVNSLFSKDQVVEDAIWIGRDALNSLRTIPRHLKWMMKDFSNKKYALDINLLGIKNEIDLVSRGLFFIGLMGFASVLLYLGVHFLDGVKVFDYRDIPFLTWVFWILSLLTIIRASILFKKN